MTASEPYQQSSQLSLPLPGSPHPPPSSHIPPHPLPSQTKSILFLLAQPLPTSSILSSQLNHFFQKAFPTLNSILPFSPHHGFRLTLTSPNQPTIPRQSPNSPPPLPSPAPPSSPSAFPESQVLPPYPPPSLPSPSVPALRYPNTLSLFS